MDSKQNKNAFENGIDLTIYKNLQASECSNDSNDQIANCNYLKRIAVGLKYYDLVCRNKIEKDDFLQFCKEIYNTFLDDYCHLISDHNYHLNIIKKELELKYLLKYCGIGQCQIIARHYRSDNKDDIDSIYLYYVDCFNRFHHQMFHLESIGFRVSMNEQKEKEEKASNVGDNIDDAFKKMKEIIFARRSKFLSNRNIERFENRNNKFNVVINDNDNNDHENKSCLFYCSFCFFSIFVNKQTYNKSSNDVFRCIICAYWGECW